MTVLLYFAVWLVLATLVYRYGRYSAWRSTDAGRAFMRMKVMLLLLVSFGLGTVLDPDGAWREPVRALIVGGILVVLVNQLSVVVRNQGGWRRRRPRPQPEVHDEPLV